MKHEAQYDVVVIGSGVVGLSAALYCGRLALKTAVIGDLPGGTIVKTNIVENYPGFKVISGLKLANNILEHAKEYPIEIVNKRVRRITRCKLGCFNVYTKQGHFHTKTLIFATGSEWRKLNIKGEKKFANRGVHYCALCDGPLYKNKIIAVVGGGDSAVKEALLLTKYAKLVYIIARSMLKAEPINMKRFSENNKIRAIKETQVKEIRGDKFVNSIILDREINNSKILKLDAIFIDIGHIPLSQLAEKLKVKLNQNKEIIIDKESKTNIKGIYAAGDVTDTRFKQAITGIGEAVKAVYSIYEYLKEEKIVCSCVHEE